MARTREEIQKEIDALKSKQPAFRAMVRNAQRGVDYNKEWRDIQNQIQSLQKESKGAQTTKQAKLEAESKAAVEEAKAKQEASKKSALGYYDTAAAGIAKKRETALGYYQPFAQEISEMPRELIDPEMKAGMMATRRTQLGAYGQTLAGMYGDEYSGVESGKRREIGMGIAGMQADLPIELQLEIAEKNRLAKLGVISAGVDVAGAQAGVEGQYAGLELGVAGGKAGVETAYQYDPGLEYIKSLGYGQGYQNKLGSTDGTTTVTSGGSMRSAPAKPKKTWPTGKGVWGSKWNMRR